MVKIMGGGGVDNSRNYKMPSARSSSVKGSFYSSIEISTVPLPSLLKIHQEILNLIVTGDTEGVIEMIRKLKVKEIVGIRGLNLHLEDIRLRNEAQMETLMWNPL
jgi:hypothetical protein